MGLRQNLFDDLAVHVGQPVVAALEAERQLRVVEAEQCRIVACRSWTWTLSFATREAELVGLAVREAAP